MWLGKGCFCCFPSSVYLIQFSVFNGFSSQFDLKFIMRSPENLTSVFWLSFFMFSAYFQSFCFNCFLCQSETTYLYVLSVLVWQKWIRVFFKFQSYWLNCSSTRMSFVSVFSTSQLAPICWEWLSYSTILKLNLHCNKHTVN